MLTRTKVPQLHDDRVDTVALERPARRRPVGEWLGEQGVVTGWPRRLGLLWVATLVAVTVIEPAPAHPDAPEPVWAGLLALALFAFLGVMGAGLARRQRLGLIASVAAGGIAIFATAMCPVSGHHESIGLWWFAQMAGFTGLVAASLVALRRTRS
ncbi:MAG TPA: hypothetical protein VFJ85_08880 [Acidimicrobiales bacterium]|nr:hypothetical protein [Acidimicrobiales bacterium]